MLKDILDVVFGALTATATVFTAWVAWRVYRAQIDAELPAVQVRIEPRPKWECWEMIVMLGNRSDVRWEGVSVRTKWPTHLRVAALREATMQRDKIGGQSWNPEAARAAAQREVPMRVAVARAGSSGGWVYGDNDSHSESFLLFARSASSRPIRAVIALNLRSTDPKARARKITVARRLPTLTNPNPN